MIGRVGSFSMPSRSEILWILAVPQSFPGDEPVGCIPIWIVKKILKEEKEKIDNRNHADKNKLATQTDVKLESKDKSHLLLLPYQREKGLHLTKSLKRNLKRLVPSTVKANVGFTGKKLSTCFQIKDKTKFEHKHDIVYLANCP